MAGDSATDKGADGLRAVSLIASATEIVHALGMGESQVGRSHECDWPPGVLNLPQLTKPRFKVEGGSKAIDIAVRELVANALAVYEVDPDGLRDLAPDVILTQDQCIVCAVSFADVERAVCQTTGIDAQIISLKPLCLADVLGDIRLVANALQVPKRGAELVASIDRRFERIKKLTVTRPRPRLAYIEWMDPLMSCGHWMPELISIAGGQPVFGETGANSLTLDWSELAECDADVIVIAPCGYDIAQTMSEIESLTGHPAWPGLKAVAGNQVYVADGNAFFNRPGPRLVESAEILAEIFHPSICDFGHRDHAYHALVDSTESARGNGLVGERGRE